MNKKFVVVSKKYHEAGIGLHVTDTELNVSMGLNDFIHAMLTEVGSPLFMLTKAHLEGSLIAAADKVVEEMKRATVYEPPPMKM